MKPIVANLPHPAPDFFALPLPARPASALRSEADRALRSRAKKSEPLSNRRLIPPKPTHKVPITPAFQSLFYAPAGSEMGSTPLAMRT